MTLNAPETDNTIIPARDKFLFRRVYTYRAKLPKGVAGGN